MDDARLVIIIIFSGLIFLVSGFAIGYHEGGREIKQYHCTKYKIPAPPSKEKPMCLVYERD